MADDSNGVVIRISGDPKDFEKAVEQTKKLFNDLSKSGEDAGEKMSLAFSVFLGQLAEKGVEEGLSLIKEGFEKIIESIIEFSKVGAEAEAVTNKFNLSLANTGKYSAKTSEDFQHFAEGLQKSTGIQNEAILANAALIQSLGNLDENGLKRATSAAADLSAALGIDFGTASNLLGKAAEGNVSVLKRYGIQVEETGDKVKDFASALNQIETRFKGTAQTANDTLAGGLTKAGVAFGDIQKEIGLAINASPALIGAVKGITTVFYDVVEIIKENKEAITDLVTNSVQLFIQGIGYAGQAAALFFDVLTNGNFVLTGIQNLISFTAESFLILVRDLVGAAEAIGKFTGINVEGITAVKEGLINLIDAGKEYRDENLAEANEFEANNEKKKAALVDFAQTAQATVQEAVDAQLAAGEEDKDAFLQAQSDKQATVLAAQDQERQDLINHLDLMRQSVVDNLGKVEAAEFDANARKLINEGNYQAAKRKIAAEEQKVDENRIFFTKKYEDQTNKERLANLQSTLGVVATLQNNATGELFEIGKAAAIAIATIDGISAVQKALASAPPPFNFALAALVGVATAANVAKIASSQPPKTGFASGGVITGGIPGIDSVPIVGQQGEIVAPTKSFDEVVEGTARQRGFVQGDENADTNAILVEIRDRLASPTINVSGVDFSDPILINRICQEIRDAVLFRRADLGVG